MRSRSLAPLSAAVVLLAAATPAGALEPLPDERIAAGVSAAGLNVSGLTIDEAAAQIESAYGLRLQEGLLVRVAGIDFKMSAETAGVTFDAIKSAKRALYAGRAAAGVTPAPAAPGAPAVPGTPAAPAAPGAPAAPAVPAPAPAPATDVPLAVEYSTQAVRRFIARIDKRLSRPAIDANLKITIRRVRITHSHPGRGIDDKALREQVTASLTDPRLPRVFKPALVRIKPKVTPAKLPATVITIQQSTFKLRLFKNLKAVKTYRVAVGQPAYPTPRGRFAIASKQVNPTWSVPNSPWAGELAGSSVAGGSAANPLKARWMGIANGVGIHGTGQDYSIGTRASHGCIRMHVGDVIALFKRVPLGTPVLIG
ncbi:MAG TPA: L,D-transpeptidase family protein [Solirubrobacteraceae bacterium]